MEQLESKHLRNEIRRLNKEIYSLKNPNLPSISNFQTSRLSTILQEADNALNKFNIKLRKENNKYAKQKQSKG